MLKAHKIFAAVSVTIFTIFLQGYILTNFSLFPTLGTFDKVFTIIFPFMMLSFLWCLLEQSKYKWRTILKIMVAMVVFNTALGAVLSKFTHLTDIYVSREYNKVNEAFLQANPAVVNLEQYKTFKHNMDNLDAYGLAEAKKNYYNIKSVDGYMADLIRITTNNSAIPELKVKLAEIDSDHYISIMEYDDFVKLVKTLPESKETQVYKNIYNKLLQSR
jgi:hypothetical protein